MSDQIPLPKLPYSFNAGQMDIRARNFMGEVERLDSAATRLVGNRFLEMEGRLSNAITELQTELYRRHKTGEVIYRHSVEQLKQWKSLKAQLDVEYFKAAQSSAEIIARAQQKAIDLGLAHSYELMGFDSSTLSAFGIVPTKAMVAMIGYAGDGTPLHALAYAHFPETAEALLEGMQYGMIRGWGPHEMAKQISDALQTGTHSILNMCRTEPNRAYRTASRITYFESGVTQGYLRVSAKDERTCLGCLFSDGEYYTSTTAFEEHPQGRCTLVPWLQDEPRPEWESGQEWFMKQDPELQKKMMGSGVYEQWKLKGFDLDKLVKRIEDPAWGNMLVPKPLREVRRFHAVTPQAPTTQVLPSGEVVEIGVRNSAGKVIQTNKKYWDTGFTKANPCPTNPSSQSLPNRKQTVHAIKRDGDAAFTKTWDEVQDIMDEIFQVSFPDINRFQELTESGSTLGDYTPMMRRIRMKVSFRIGDRYDTIIHELGHHIDFITFGKANDYATRSRLVGKYWSDEMKVGIKKWREAAGGTKTIKGLEDIVERVRKGWGHPNGDWATYALDDAEIWARSFSQYIAKKSGNEKLLGVINRDIGNGLSSVWKWDEFEPIYQAFDEMFESLGWLK